MWIALTQSLTPGLEETFRRAMESRGPEFGEVGRRYGLNQVRVFLRANVGLITLEVDDVDRFRNIADDPDFQVLGQELSGLIDLRALGQERYSSEIFGWQRTAAEIATD